MLVWFCLYWLATENAIKIGWCLAKMGETTKSYPTEEWTIENSRARHDNHAVKKRFFFIEEYIRNDVYTHRFPSLPLFYRIWSLIYTCLAPSPTSPRQLI